MNLKLLAAFIFCMAIGASGRLIGEEIPSREIDGISLAADQGLGALRSLPLIRLWQRADRAKQDGRYEELQAIYDLITEITPSNGQIIYHQIINEGQTIAAMQESRESAWPWVESALKRGAAGRERRVASQEPFVAEFMVGHRSGRVFPLRFSEKIAELYGIPELAKEAQALQKSLESPKIQKFREWHWKEHRIYEDPLDSEIFSALPQKDKDALIAADRLLSKAMAAIAARGIAEPRYQSSTIVICAIVNLNRYHAIDSEVEAAEVKAKSRKIIDKEYKRLLDEGYPAYARSFRDHAFLLIGED